MADWYYKSMGAEVGPISNKEMLDLVRKGKVTPETEVRKDDSNWHKASKVGGLIEQAQQGTVQQVCPYCGHLVPSPPAKCGGCSRWVTMSVESKDAKEETKTKRHDPAAKSEQQREDEIVDLDEGPAKYALLTFAIAFVGFLFVFVVMVMQRNWTTGWFVTLGCFGVVCFGALSIGLWLRKKAVRRALGGGSRVTVDD